MAHNRSTYNGNLMVCPPSDDAKLNLSMAVISISIIYAYILSSLRRLDRSIAHSFLSTSTNSQVGGRRESVYPTGTGDRRGSSLIPPIPNSYGVVESGQGGKIGV
jgi:hypothetical protein